MIIKNILNEMIDKGEVIAIDTEVGTRFYRFKSFRKRGRLTTKRNLFVRIIRDRELAFNTQIFNKIIFLLLSFKDDGIRIQNIDVSLLRYLIRRIFNCTNQTANEYVIFLLCLEMLKGTL